MRASLHALPLRTVVSRQFVERGDSASDLVERNLRRWQNELRRGISQIIDAFRHARPRNASNLFPQASVSAFPTMWLFCQGHDSTNLGYVQVAGALSGSMMRPFVDYKADASKEVSDILAGRKRVTVSDSALSLAHTFAHHGHLELAVVQIAVACESALSQAYARYVKSRGCSNKKLKRVDKDITFSSLLNVHIFAMADLSKLPDRDAVLNEINEIRLRRNESVHEGAFKETVTPEIVESAIDRAEQLIEFVASVSPEESV